MLLALPLIIVWTGCQRGITTYKVEGTVIYDGQPVSGADITFHPTVADGHLGYARTDDQGKFILQTKQGKPGGGTVPGEYVVQIKKMESFAVASKLVGSDGVARERVEGRNTLPAILGTDKSPIKLIVEKKSMNMFDIDLSSYPTK